MTDAAPIATAPGLAPAPVRLADYAPFGYRIDRVALRIVLDPVATRVQSRIAFRRAPGASDPTFFLQGEGLRLISARIDGVPVTPRITEAGLTCAVPETAFLWEAEVEIAPGVNTALEGLYMSPLAVGDAAGRDRRPGVAAMYCTQCEAEGFRKITFYPDRPDVMAPFTVRIESDLPVLLSNGNPVASGPGWTEWDDPWPKPAYLFALVAGDLVAHSDRFVTTSGRDVALNIWVRPGDEGKCAFAMGALKRAMAWDEEVYGREYDLDVFNIVAVDDFNMGAMENKGLNIFNARYVLASPDTATDRDHAAIEAIVAHEYFHNWTGNRITCRDWFQLCLKEGLTVFRDQQFSADLRGAAVSRIVDVLQLRARQFREDAGPLAHNVRPEAYVEINNFYTATVYEKGAEIIGMLRRRLGPGLYRAGTDLYFARHDGQACTIEDWLACFEEVAASDLSQFKRWYTQAGTPRVTARWRRAGDVLHLDLAQSVPPTPGQPLKEPVVIPVAMGLLDGDGREILPTTLIDLDGPSRSVAFDLAALAGGTAPAHVVPSLLRGFSAPVILEADLSSDDRALLLAHDTDPFNRWEAGRSLLSEVLVDHVLTRPATAAMTALRDRVRDAIGATLGDEGLDPAFRALVLSLPSEDAIAQAIVDRGAVPDPTAIRAGRDALMADLGRGLQPLLTRLHAAQDPGPDYSPDAASAGRRDLRNSVLRLLSAFGDLDLARARFAEAGNMTDQVAALSCLIAGGDSQAAEAFAAQWHGDRLVMDKWFALCVAVPPPAQALARAEELSAHALFDWTNPNRFRALVGGLVSNPAAFHDPSGAGYRFLADWLIRLDAVNPQTAARMSAAFETWARYDADRQALIRDEMARIAAAPGLSRDLAEMIDRMRAT